MLFDKNISAINWETGEVIVTRKAVRMFQLMGRSERWDRNHATGDVRKLHSSDAIDLGIDPENAVIFIQQK